MDEVLQQIKNLNDKIDAVNERLDALGSVFLMPNDIEDAMRARLLDTSNLPIANVTVILTKDPIGVTVLGLPDKFIKLEDGYSIPSYKDK